MINEKTLQMMDKYGGSFVRHLAVLYRLGDEENRQILEKAFVHYFTEYGDWAARKEFDTSTK